MEFARRCTVRTTAVARIRSWSARSAPYAIEEINSLYGLPRRWVLVHRLPNGNQSIVSRHRKRSAVERAARRLP